VKKTKQQQHPDSEVENVEYQDILNPSPDSFIHSYRPLNFSLLDLCIKYYFFLQKTYFSSYLLQNKKEEIVIKKIKKTNKKGKKQ